MRFDHASIVKIFCPEIHPTEFGGTGFLVTPHHVITCAHVVDVDHRGLRAWEAENCYRDFRDLKLEFGENPHLVAQRRGRLVACAAPDLALISLNEPVAVQPLPLICGLTSDHQAALSQLRGSVIGFSQAEYGKLTERPVEGYLSLFWDFHSRRLLSMQVTGGLANGMSGSPFLVDIRNQAVCFGMAYLGGDSAATSRLICSEVLLRFVSQFRIASPTIFRATEWESN